MLTCMHEDLLYARALTCIKAKQHMFTCISNRLVGGRTLQDDSLLERRIPCWWVWRQPSASMMDVLDDWISVMTLIKDWKWDAFHLYSKTGEPRLKISYLREFWMSPKESIDRTAVTKQTWTGQPLQGKNSKIAITEQPWQIAIIGLRQQDC